MMTYERVGTVLRPWLGLAAGAFMLLPLAAGPARATPLYNTTRVLKQQGNACVGATGCKVIASEPRRIKAGRGDQISARCPDTRPYLVNWDASYHEHIGLRQVKRRQSSVSVAATNHADAPGQVTLFIGCAKRRPTATLEIQSLGALPTKALPSRPR